jgi:hypothetical protein
MDDEARAALCQLVARHGAAVTGDGRRLRALLNDTCPGCRREVHVLAVAVEHGVARDLRNSAKGSPRG